MLRIKFGSKRIELDPKNRSLDSGHQLVTSMEESVRSGAKKRGPQSQGIIENQREKRLKMDTSSSVKLQKMGPTEKVQCLAILKSLMADKDGWAFLEPVDPVKLQIPDYLTVISRPMDLGTIRSKLDRNMYMGAEEFAADVRLTFSNAMLYNSVSNVFHQMAKNLNERFEMRWRSLYGKFNHEISKVEPGKSSSEAVKQVPDTKQNPRKTTPLNNMWVTKRSIPCQQKVRPFGANSNDGDAGILKTAKNHTHKLLPKSSNRFADRGIHKQASSSITGKQQFSRVGRKCNLCGRIVCECRLPSDNSTCQSLSGLASQRSIGRDHILPNVNASSRDCGAKRRETSQICKSDVALSALDDERVSSSTSLTTTPVRDAFSGDGLTVRVANLRVRYAGLISKAQTQILFDHCDKSDPLKIQQEKARLKQRLLENKARAESVLRAAEAAKQMEAEIESKQQRERKRAEARIAVESIKKTVEIDTEPEIRHVVDVVAGLLPCRVLRNYNGWPADFGGSKFVSPLEQLGLSLKPEYAGDDDDDSILYEVEREEGEIF